MEDSTRHNSQPRNKEMVKFKSFFVLSRWRERSDGQRRTKHKEPRERSTGVSSSIHCAKARKEDSFRSTVSPVGATVVAIGAETRKSSITHRIYIKRFPREYGEVGKDVGKKSVEMEGNAVGVKLDFGSAEIEGNFVQRFGNVSFMIPRMDDNSRDFLHSCLNGE